MKTAKQRATALQAKAVRLGNGVIHSNDAQVAKILNTIDILPPEKIRQIKNFLNTEYKEVVK